MDDKKDTQAKKKSKNKESKPGRGIESMYRISMNSHVQFNKIADNKANILISVNAIIVSILLSTLLPEFLSGNHLSLRIPFAIFILTCLLTVVFSIVATIPKHTKNYINLDKMDNKVGEYLFFGNFSKMTMEEYVIGMREFQKNDTLTYDALSQNFYILGQALATKYRLLHIAYRIFLAGFIISVIAFAVAMGIS